MYVGSAIAFAFSFAVMHHLVTRGSRIYRPRAFPGLPGR
jgi:hypothetical protein